MPDYQLPKYLSNCIQLIHIILPKLDPIHFCSQNNKSTTDLITQFFSHQRQRQPTDYSSSSKLISLASSSHM